MNSSVFNGPCKNDVPFNSNNNNFYGTKQGVIDLNENNKFIYFFTGDDSGREINKNYYEFYKNVKEYNEKYGSERIDTIDIVLSKVEEELSKNKITEYSLELKQIGDGIEGLDNFYIENNN